MPQKPLSHSQKHLVKPIVIIELRMERHPELISVPNSHYVAANPGEHLNLLAHLGNKRRSNERHGHVFLPRKGGVRMKTPQLPAIGVASNRYGHRGESASPAIRCTFNPIGKQNEPRTGSEHRHAAFDAFAKRPAHPQFMQQLDLYRALSPRQDQAVERLFEIGCLPQFDARATQLRETAFVFDECPLHGKNADCLPIPRQRFAACMRYPHHGILFPALGHQQIDLLLVDAHHSRAEIFRQRCDHLGIAVVRDGLHD